jgi:hypothetical protein
VSFATAKTLLNQAATQLGLISEDITDPYTSTDANIVLLRSLLTTVGQSLVRERPWKNLRQTYTFSTDAIGTLTYALPTDYRSMVEQTEWNRTRQMPLVGAVGSQGWQALKALSNTAALDKYFRIQGNKFEVHPAPSAVETIAYEYNSEYWVMASGQTVPNKATPTASDDTLWHDPVLLLEDLKTSYREERGYDTTANMGKRKRAWNAAVSADGAAARLRLSGRATDGSSAGAPGVPETGFGV